MFGASKLKFLIAGLGLIGFAATVSPASAATIELTVVDTGTTVGNSKLFRADIGPSGLSSVNRLTLTDNGTPAGGSPGIFSGFDLDTFFIDLDGNFATAGDRISPLAIGSGLAFTAGSVRPFDGAHPEWQPTNAAQTNPAHPGPLFGTLDASTLHLSVATLDDFDATAIANVFTASGYFTFGDGGELVWTFSDLLLAANPNMTLFFGEVAGQVGEGLLVSVSSVPLPGAVWLFLSAIAVLFGMSRRRSAVAA